MNRPPRQQKHSRSQRWQDSFKQPKQGQFFIAGWNGIGECLASQHVTIHKLWVDSAKLKPEQAKRLQPFERVTESLRGRDTPYGPISQGIAGLVGAPSWPELPDILDTLNDAGRPPFLIVLDQVEDPMNLGQIMRTCEGAGVDGVVVARHRAAHLNQTVAQVSQGAFAWVPLIEVINLRQALELMQARGLWLIGCEAGPDSKPWFQCDLRDPIGLVFGSEGKGLRSLTAKVCDHLAALPMNGHLNSLNVSASVAAFVYEALRQRQK